jgi:hypothetical protein
MTVIDSDAWQSTVGERCRELDALADPRRAYTHEECEKVLMFQRLLGKRTYEAALKDLCSASTNGVQTRKTLGFDRPRDHVGENRHIKYERNRRLPGVPSASTMSRYRNGRFMENEREALYHECFLRIVEEHADKFPEFSQELRVLGADGSTQKTIWHPRYAKEPEDRVDEETGELIEKGTPILDENGEPRHVPQDWDGGSATSDTLPESKKGHGFLLVTAHTGSAFPVGMRTGKIHESEAPMLADIAEHDLSRLRARMSPDEFGVCTLDGAYSGRDVRRALREVGYVENTHFVSHGNKDVSRRNRKKTEATVYAIEGYPNWRVNGMRELFCMCGEGNVTARPRMLKDGTVSPSVEGTCDTCGSIHITSGDWRQARNPSRYVLVDPSNARDVEEADLLFGNPLTYNDKKSEAYGRNRYSQGEGLHGTLATGWGLLKDGAHYRRRRQFSLDVLLAYCLMHGLGMKARELRDQAGGEGPGGVTPLHPGRSGPPDAGEPPGDAIAA